MKKYFILLILFSSFLFPQEKNNMYYYSCLINKTDKIKMRMEINNNIITGNYVIPDSGIRITFTGKLDNTSFVLTTVNYDQTKEFMSGSFTKDFSSFTGTILDTVFKKNSVIKGNLEYTGKTLTSKEFKITVNYPSPVKNNPFYNKGLTKILEDIAKDEVQNCLNEGKIHMDNNPDNEAKLVVKNDFKWETNIYIENLSKNILSVVKVITHYFNTEKPNDRYLSVNIDLRKNRNMLLKYADLFKNDTASRRILSDLIMENLAVQKATYVLQKNFTDLMEDLRNDYLTYLVLPEGIRYDFAPDTVALPSERSFFVFIPYNKMRNILNLKGVLSEYKIK
jgi:hypothetical protein